MKQVVMWMVAGVTYASVLSGGWAQVPELVSYRGRLVEDGALVNGSTQVVFRLYNDETAGDVLFVETQAVEVVQGLFSTFIGESPDQGTLADAVTHDPLYLELQVGTTVLSPRERMGSVCYAMQAGSVSLGGITTAMLADGVVTGDKIGAVEDLTITGTLEAKSIQFGDGAGQTLQFARATRGASSCTSIPTTRATRLKAYGATAPSSTWPTTMVVCTATRWTGSGT